MCLNNKTPAIIIFTMVSTCAMMEAIGGFSFGKTGLKSILGQNQPGGGKISPNRFMALRVAQQ